MKIDVKEWQTQSDYDFNTAKAMFESGRYIYSVFMCHLSIEKALEGLFAELTESLPPKSHKLIYFVDKLTLEPPKEIDKFITILNDQGVVTRYPESLENLISVFTKARTDLIIKQTDGALKWI